jgi:hypothetical protein
VATNKLGPGTVNIGVNLPKELRAKLEKLAKKSGKKLSAYVRDVLNESVKAGVVYEQVRTESPSLGESAEKSAKGSKWPGNPPDSDAG